MVGDTRLFPEFIIENHANKSGYDAVDVVDIINFMFVVGINR